MESFGIIHLFDEYGQIRLCIGKRFVLLEIHFLLLQCLKKAFCLGIVVRITYRGHADLRSDLLQLLSVVIAGILDSAISMMDQSRRRAALCNRMLECR